ncbi:MAG: hypothetical protein K2N47_00710 [Clostridia bacterium]|nr:hypothetical protein [Clostridia bacterium]
MSKKNKKIKETTIEDYYDLKTKEMDELVSALKGETSENDKPVSYKISDCIGEEATKQGEASEYKKSSKEFNPYKLDRLSRIPTWIKAFFIKFWFAGMVCYLTQFGLGMIITNDENRMLLTGVVLGIVVDVLVNPALRYFQSSDHEYDNYMMFPFPFKKFWTFFTNVIYYVVVALTVMYMYRGLNFVVDAIKGTPDAMKIHVGVEPLLYGVFCFIADMAFIGIKDLIVYLVKRKKRRKAEALAIQKEIDGVAGDAATAKVDANGQPAAEEQKSADKKPHKDKKGRK